MKKKLLWSSLLLATGFVGVTVLIYQATKKNKKER